MFRQQIGGAGTGGKRVCSVFCMYCVNECFHAVMDQQHLYKCQGTFVGHKVRSIHSQVHLRIYMVHTHICMVNVQDCHGLSSESQVTVMRIG